MDSTLLKKGLKRIASFMILAFTGPVIIHQAFQNEGHPLYYLVLVVGLLLTVISIIMGFWGIRTLTNGLLGPRSSKKK